MSNSLRVIAFGLVCLCGSTAMAQQSVDFFNDLDVPINFILTNRADGSEITLGPIVAGGTIPFVIPPGSRFFDGRIMPIDNTGSGGRLVNRDLPAIAANANGRPVVLGGIVEERCRTYCCKRRFCRRSKCYTTCERVRVAFFMDEFDATGGTQRITVPVESY